MASQKKKEYDVRAIRYIKARPEIQSDGKTASVPLKEELVGFCTQEKCQYVICLSHFDYLIFDCLSQRFHGSPLEIIDQDRKAQMPQNTAGQGCSLKEDNYTYPLYMLLEVRNAEEKECVNQFWKQESDYTSVVRIHYRRGEKEEQQKQQEQQGPQEQQEQQDRSHLGVDFFIQQMQTLGIDISTRKSSSITVNIPAINGKTVSVAVNCLVYDSLELGDCVVILKSSSMVAALNVSRTLNQIPCVLDCYTYIGISPELFTETNKHGDQQRDQIKLDSASTRFTVKALKDANSFFDQYCKNEEIGFITGTTDARIRWKGDPSGNLSEKMFLDKISKLNPHLPEFHQAFRDVITRTGIAWVKTEQNDQKPIFSPDYNKLFNVQASPAIRWFLEGSEIPEWLKNDDLLYLSLKKLLGAVQAMGQDGVMDALADLLIPSMRALFSRLYELRKSGWRSEYKGILEDFLQDYYSLIQNISQLESQLVQHPEIYPVPYYIPAAVLQFELQFTRYCSILFRDDGDGKERKYVFFPVLIPRYQSVASTSAPLDPCFGGVAAEEDTPISPLRIYLPIKLLYRPYDAAHQLCHEIAHYCGDATRKRETRFRALCTCCAAMLMKSWEEMLGEEDCTIDWNDPYMEQELNRLGKILAGGCDAKSGYYLVEVEIHLQRKILEIGMNPQYYEHFHNILFARVYMNQAEIIRAKLMTMQSQMNPMLFVHYWSHHIDYLKTLFRECYADLAMLKLLDCGAKSYCQCFLESFARYDQEYATDEEQFCDVIFKNSSVKLQIDRLAFVLHHMGERFISDVNNMSTSSLSIQYALSQAEMLEELSDTTMQNQKREAIRERHRWNVKYKNDSTMTEIECKQIVNYLKECGTELDQKIAQLDKKKITTLRDALNAISPNGFDWAEVQEFVWTIQHDNGIV